MTVKRQQVGAWAEVHLDAIAHNIREIRRGLPASCKFMAAVKANGYGHGVVQAAFAAVQAGAEELAVSQLGEAVTLREHGVEVPILVLTPPSPMEVNKAAEHQIALPVFQAEWLQEMRESKTTSLPLRLHIKMDSGMGRIGLRTRSELRAMLPWLRADDIIIEGVYTHLATANQEDDRYYKHQLQRFDEMRSWLEDEGLRNIPAHCGNSAVALQYPGDAAKGMAMIRVGAAIYGIHTCDEEVRQRSLVNLEPTLSLHAEIIHVKRVGKGEYVGYDSSYRADAEEWIATVPIGYADGYYRGYKGFYLLVDGQKAPIVGNVCMDQVMIRLPYYCPVGTLVTAIGSQQGHAITLEDLAAHIGSIPQQILSFLTQRVPRHYAPAPRGAEAGRMAIER